jgi:transposase
VVVVGQDFQDSAGRARSVITLRHDERFDPICSECGNSVSSIHSSFPRRVLDLCLADAKVELVIPNRKVRCPRCGERVERHDFVEPYRRLTKRFERAVEDLVRVTSIRATAEHFGLDWSTVKEIDKRRLQREVGTPNYDGLREIAVDEIAVHKGHRYMTVVLDLALGRVVWVGKGRSADTLGGFFSLLSPEQRGSIEAIAVDMSAAFTEAIREHCPQAAIVYDLFHMVAKYGREVIDRTRIDERKRQTKEGSDVFLGAKYLLLSNRTSLKLHQRVRLSELLLANESLSTVFILKEQLKHLWTYTSEGWARKALEEWCAMAEESGLKPLIRFAASLRRHAEGIINHCRYKLHTSRIEGVNNKIKVIKRIAYGFRDDDYFILKIKGAFPGKNLQPNP